MKWGVWVIQFSIPAVQEMKLSEKPTGTFCPELFNCETVLHFEPRHQNFLGVHSLRGLYFSYANGYVFFSKMCRTSINVNKSWGCNWDKPIDIW